MKTRQWDGIPGQEFFVSNYASRHPEEAEVTAPGDIAARSGEGMVDIAQYRVLRPIVLPHLQTGNDSARKDGDARGMPAFSGDEMRLRAYLQIM